MIRDDVTFGERESEGKDWEQIESVTLSASGWMDERMNG